VPGRQKVIIQASHVGYEPKTGQFVVMDSGNIPEPLKVFSTSKAFRVNPELKNRLPKSFWQEDKRVPVGKKTDGKPVLFQKACVGSPGGA